MIKALVPDLALSDESERDINPKTRPIDIHRLIRLDGGQAVAAFSRSLDDTDTRVYILSESGEHKPVPGLDKIDKMWPAGDWLLLLVERTISLVSINGDVQRLTDIPEGAHSVDAVWHSDGIRVGAIVSPKAPDGPGLFPSERPLASLQAYAPSTGWRKVSDIRSESSHLSLSADGTRCAWRESLNTVPEEAMRGEFRACDLTTGEIKKLTDGAGKAWFISMVPDGSGVVYQANFELLRPITTHTDIYFHGWDETSPVRLTERGRNVDDFGWLDDKTLWVNYIEGVDRLTESLTLDGASEALDDAAQGEVIRTEKGKVVFAAGDRDTMPFLAFGSERANLPGFADYADLQVRVVDWRASDGLGITGVIYEANDTPDGAPLLIRAHGGPAGDVEATRAGAIRHAYLLRSGYRILEPAFRGSLGFGDDFLGANIGCQGTKDLDDIVTGIDHLTEFGIADPERVGIFGGSYGGYMTLRAVAVTDRFKTGVALYGFIDNRWMTLETGDFTYEDEYIAPVTWPMDSSAVTSDVFSHLHQINCPLLLLHGDQDPICTLSQSKIVYRALEHRGVQAGLVVYPGEGHGFRKPEHQKDCARRTLTWFEEFLPV